MILINDLKHWEQGTFLYALAKAPQLSLRSALVLPSEKVIGVSNIKLHFSPL